MAVEVEKDPRNLSPATTTTMPDAQKETENCCWDVEDTLNDEEDVAVGDRHGDCKVL
jgi:hypothetical protein